MINHQMEAKSVRDLSTLPNSISLEFVEELYADYVNDPQSVPQDWRNYFARLSPAGHVSNTKVKPTFTPRSIFNPVTLGVPSSGFSTKDQANLKQDRVNQLIREYRVRGHLVAKVDPLGQTRPSPSELSIEKFGLQPEDLEQRFSTETGGGATAMTLHEIIAHMQQTYCQSIGCQYMHIDDVKIRAWLARRIESSDERLVLSPKEQMRIYTRLYNSVLFEEFIQTKYTGAKSFSLEGAETLIPLLDLLIEQSAESEVNEIVIGMAHRGRLNVLTNIMNKGYDEIFREFNDSDAESSLGGGDVKYHLGYSSDWKTATGKMVHLSLCFNPSHLEYVNPVLVGRVRAKQDRAADEKRIHHMAVQIHGDAAFIGEGIVQETLNLSELPGYRVGGSIHIIVNNQIGFTTLPTDGMSTVYNTDIAKMLQIPIFHVNGEHPEAVAQVVKIAMDFRTKFQKDVVIDMYCYRRRGHNESDEPRMTQPDMYRAIERHSRVHEAYLENLVLHGGITVEQAEAAVAPLRERLEQNFMAARQSPSRKRQEIAGVWKGFRGGPIDPHDDTDTSIPQSMVNELLIKLSEVPEGFVLHNAIGRHLKNRKEMAAGNKMLDWSAGEALAFGSLLLEGHPLRMSGQDAQRGTFSHRHAVVHDQQTGKQHLLFAHLGKNQASVEIINSTLSESGVMGFEYGYSQDCPQGLVIWEAQFGDFCNVAQVVIDQFIVSAEDKWGRLSSLVLLLPHGFEGAGPEHSSARLERFLQLAAEDNIQVMNLTTPAQLFHALRRQVLRVVRKPLVIMTPKSLLRHPEAVSNKEEITNGAFEPFLPDAGQIDPKKVTRILMCSGKVYYDLVAERRNRNRNDVAIVRMEQLYPINLPVLEEVLSPYPVGTQLIWVQEEPSNMGAWWSVAMRLGPSVLGKYPLRHVSRVESASPATGSPGAHKIEQARLLQQAFDS